MDARIRLTGGDVVANLASLWDWLRAEPDLRGHVRSCAAPPNEGEMGPVVDVLTVTLESGGAGAVLAGSLTTWLRQRRSDITVIVSTPKGRIVRLEARQVTDPLPLLREALRSDEQ